MDSIDVELDDLFGVPEAEEADDVREDESDGADNEKSSRVVEVKKRIVRNPQPKLDSNRLCSSRGIPELSKVFEDVTFQGKGHELDDLNNVMGLLEHWGHRLFPKLPFDHLLERIEKLGSKKPVQNCLSRIRLDMMADAEDQDKQDDIQREGDKVTFDDLIRQNRESTTHQNPRSPESVTSEIIEPTTSQSHVISEIIKPTTSQSQTFSEEFTIKQKILTGEEKERIERNRKIAEQKKAARISEGSTDIKEQSQIHQVDQQQTNLIDNNTMDECSQEELMEMIDDTME